MVYGAIILGHPGCDIFVTTIGFNYGYFPKISRVSGGLVMRLIAVLAVLSTLIAVGGCFHHTQMTTVEPIELPPLK